MTNEILVEKIVQSLLSLQVEAVQNDIVQVTGTSKGTPVKVKVKVRKKDKADVYHNVISVPKRHPTKTAIEKIRLVNSDQTIMSFDMIMNTDQTLPSKKHRNKFFELLRPGICLGNSNDERESYQPSQNQDNYGINSKSDEIMKTHLALSKNDYFDISTVVSKRQNQKFLGKCKPGGCLDPPFGEDKYSYTPIKKQLQLETSTLTTKNLYLGDDVRDLKRDSLIKSTSSKDNLSHHDNTTDLKLIQPHPQTNSILNLYRAESVNTSLSVTYSNSIITYPPPLTPSEIRLNNEKTTQQRISTDNKSRKSFNEFSSTYFITPKEIKNQIEHKNYEQEMLRFEDEKISLQPALCLKSESSSDGKKDHISSPLQSDKNIENVHREVTRNIISPTKEITQFEDFSTSNLEIAPAVNGIVGIKEEALTNYIETDTTILPYISDSKNESIHEINPITLSVHELVSCDITSKSASIPIKSLESTIKPSIRSSLAETNLIISKTLSEQLVQQEALILNKTFTLPPFLEDNFKNTDKRSFIQIKKSKSDSKMIDRTAESENSIILNKETDSFSKTSPEQLSQQENLMIRNNLNLPLSLEINDKSLDNRSSIQSRISKSDSQKFFETAELDVCLISSKLDNEVAQDHMDDECKVDGTKKQILQTGLDLKVGHLLEEALNDTEKEPSTFNSSISSKSKKTSHILNSSDDQYQSALDKDTVPSPVTSTTQPTFEIKEQQPDLIFRNSTSTSKESVSSKLVKTTVNLDTKDNRTIKNGSTENLTNYLNDDKTQNNQLDSQSDMSKDNKLSEDTSIYDNKHTFKNQIKNKFERSYNGDETSENDGFIEVENLGDRKNIPSNPSLVAKSTLSKISSTNYEAKEIKYEQNQLDKYESEDTTQENSNVKEGFKEILKETKDQPLGNGHKTIMPFPQQKEDLSHIDTSLHKSLTNPNLENDGFNIQNVVLPSEDALLNNNKILSAEITTNLKLLVSKEALESDKLQEKKRINSTEELANLIHDNKNQFRASVVESNIPNIRMDKSQLLDNKSKTLQMIDTKEDSLNYSPEVTNEDIKMFPDQYDEQVKVEINSDILDKPTEHRISYSKIDYSHTYSTSEPVEVNDTLIHEITERQVNGMKSIGATTMKHDFETTAEIKSDEHVDTKYYELKNNKITQNEIANSALPGKISSEASKNNLIDEAANQIDESEFNKSDPLEIQYTTMPLYSPNIKDTQKKIINNLEEKKVVSNLERPKIEKLSTIFDLVAMPDTAKLKREITALKSRSVLYTPSENTLTKATGKETVTIDLAFQSYVNNENKIMLKTFNSENEPQRYSDDRVIIMKSDISLYNNEMKIPIDSENSLFLQIKKVVDPKPENVLKDAQKVYHTDIASNKFQTSDAMAPNLHYIYEKELLPLQIAMKDLKAEIDHLAGHSSILKDNLITRKSKNLRLSNINRKCVCLKRLF